MKVRMTVETPYDLLEIIFRSPVASTPGALDTLAMYMTQSVEVWTGRVDERVACVCGLIPPTLLSDRAYLWLLTTDVVTQHRFLFVRHSQIWMENVLKRYSAIYGHVHVDNEAAKAWLRWLGAEFEYTGSSAIAFTIRKKSDG